MKNEEAWTWCDGKNFYVVVAIFLALAAGKFCGLFAGRCYTAMLAARSETKSETKPATVEIRVRKGQTLSGIAAGLGTTIEDIMKLNRLKNPDFIQEGQVLKIVPYNRADIVEVSWYGPGFQGKMMSNKCPFNMNDPNIAAHKFLSFNTKVKLTNPATGKSITVIIQDRGPYIKGRHFDLSKGAAEELGIKELGHALCKVEVIG